MRWDAVTGPERGPELNRLAPLSLRVRALAEDLGDARRLQHALDLAPAARQLERAAVVGATSV